MARKSEKGILYFPLNTDIINSTKIKLIITEFGPKAWAVLIPLLCKIYREKGYYIDWKNEDLRLLFSQDECRCDLSFADEVVSGLVKRGFFDKTLFDKFGILTSDRIQENYLEAKKRNKDVNVYIEYTLIPFDKHNGKHNVHINPLNVDINPENVYTGTQNRIEEKKGEEITHVAESIQNPNSVKAPPEEWQVIEAFIRAGGRLDQAKKFFDKYSAIGWKIKGNPITNWVVLIRSFLDTWNEINSEREISDKPKMIYS